MENNRKRKTFQKLKKKGSKQQGYRIKLRSAKFSKQAKKKYKDTVFTKLFNNEAAAIQLYNSLYHKNLPEDTPVKIVTLDDVLFTKRFNSVAKAGVFCTLQWNRRFKRSRGKWYNENCY